MSDLEVTTSGRGGTTLDEPSEERKKESSSIRRLGSTFGVPTILRNECSSSGPGAGTIPPPKTRMGTHLRLREGE